MREIQISADVYLAAHPELIDDARARALRIAANDLKSQIGRALLAERNSRHSRKPEVRTNRGLPLNATHAQNGSGE
jgi:hypothetical protein